MPEEGFFYLLGILVSENSKQVYHSFWSNTPDDEEASWQEAIKLLESYSESPIYHYGSYETAAFDVMSKRFNTNVENLKERFVNVNTHIFGKIYFPTYSNGLKELSQALGMQWTNQKASGLQSIVWRNYWDEGQEEYKNNILTYNREDCIALKILTDELARIQTASAVSNDLDFIQNPKKIASEISNGLHDQFKLVLELAHNDYDQRKIKIDLVQKAKSKTKRKKKKKTGFIWLGKKLVKPSKSILIPADKYCFKHLNRKLNKSKIESKRVLIDLVFRKSGLRKMVIEHIGKHGYCPLCNNSYPPVYIRQISRQLYGHNYKSWYVFQRIEIQLSFSKINESLHGLIRVC